MSIVEIEEAQYCQIILNGWNSYILIDPVEAADYHTDFTTMAKFSIGATDTLTIEQINTFLKLANADFSVEIAAADNSSISEFTQYTIPIATLGTIERIQVAGQETIN